MHRSPMHIGVFKIDCMLSHKTYLHEIKERNDINYPLRLQHTENRRWNRNGKIIQGPESLIAHYMKKQCVGEEIRKEIERFLETNENEDTGYQNLWNTTKVVLKRKVHSYASIH